ncbi:MAG: quinolinate synthase [Deltaproteobacteria bacterium HGW-Deltaproteobacteria-19]|jgi:quinolinate synthase|nr:MAG: quinolinate synthase [Deltaproteobacteria bacterium HGW-Deltaproteobacteria-19]
MNLVEKIQELKRKRNAVILAHNYQLPEVQDIADYVGDSLGLSIQAAATPADVIVFCGVHFMAETAKILSPAKTVLLPEEKAGCPMADMITAEELKTLKAQHPGAAVLCYVNTSAAVKAECDLCCTSANAVRMVQDVLKDEQEIIFVPDRYLASYVASQTGRNLILWNGFCPTHARILPENIAEAKERHPGAEVMVHPECTPELIRLADKVASTEGMCRYAGESKNMEFIVATERGILHRMEKENPGKKFHAASKFAICPNMKYTTLEKVLWSLEDMVHEIVVPEDIADRARRCIERMLAA